MPRVVGLPGRSFAFRSEVQKKVLGKNKQTTKTKKKINDSILIYRFIT